MKLLNLWPREISRVEPVKRFKQEVLFMLLCVVVLSLGISLRISAYQSQANQTYNALQSEWDQVNPNLQLNERDNERARDQMPRVLRQQLSGQLDWMGELSHWTADGNVRWLSVKTVPNSEVPALQLEGFARNEAAIEGLLQQIQEYYAAVVTIGELKNIGVDRQKWWRISVYLPLTPKQVRSAPEQETSNSDDSAPVEKMPASSEVSAPGPKGREAS